jgi:hypothetical protein
LLIFFQVLNDLKYFENDVIMNKYNLNLYKTVKCNNFLGYNFFCQLINRLKKNSFGITNPILPHHFGGSTIDFKRMTKELAMGHFIIFQLICKIPNDKIIHVNVFNYTNTHIHTTSIGWKHITINTNIVTNIVFLDVAFWTSNKPIQKKKGFVMILHIITTKNMKKTMVTNNKNLLLIFKRFGKVQLKMCSQAWPLKWTKTPNKFESCSGL